LKGDSPSADFCLVTDKIMPENPHIHPMWTGSKKGTKRNGKGGSPYKLIFIINKIDLCVHALSRFDISYIIWYNKTNIRFGRNN